MVEIEVRVEVDKFPEIKAEPVSEKRVLDIYYDTKDYSLLRGGNFLRNRNNKSIDFKLKLDDNPHLYCVETNFKYDSFNNKKNIKEVHDKYLGISFNSGFNNFEEYLEAHNLVPLAVIDKYRKVYKMDDIIISFDDTKDIGKIIEAEINVENDAANKEKYRLYLINKLIEQKLINKNYTTVKIGAVEMYLKKHNKKAYELGLYKD